MNKLFFVLHSLVVIILLWIPLALGSLSLTSPITTENIVVAAGMTIWFGFIPWLFLGVGLVISYKKKKYGLGLLISSIPIIALLMWFASHFI